MSLKDKCEKLILAQEAEKVAAAEHQRASEAVTQAHIALKNEEYEYGTYYHRVWVGGSYKNYSCQLADGYVAIQELQDL